MGEGGGSHRTVGGPLRAQQQWQTCWKRLNSARTRACGRGASKLVQSSPGPWTSMGE